MELCKGINGKGLRCKNKSFRCPYCRYHENQAVIEFYPGGEGWPTANEILRCIGVFKYINNIMDHVRYYYTLCQNDITHLTEKDAIIFQKRICFMKCAEMIKKNRVICYGNERMEKLLEVLVIKFSEIPELADYLEDFKRKCIKSHRDQAQKRLIWFYFQRTQDLYYDVCEKIMENV